MKQNFKLLVVLLTFMMTGANMWSATQGVYPIELSASLTKTDPKLNGFPKPSKSPARRINSLLVLFDDVNMELMFVEESSNIYVFTISDTSGQVVSQGVLNFSMLDAINVNIASLSGGDYIIEVTKMSSNEQFFGSFSVE